MVYSFAGEKVAVCCKHKQQIFLSYSGRLPFTVKRAIKWKIRKRIEGEVLEWCPSDSWTGISICGQLKQQRKKH